MANNLSLKDLISTKRLYCYKNINEHFDNLIFISKITPKIATIEICVRNIFDIYQPKDWIINSQDNEILKQVQIIQHRYGNDSINHEQYLSNLTLGQVVYLVKQSGLNHSVFFDNIDNIDFKKYCSLNINYYKNIKGEKIKLSNQQKMKIILSLLVDIRNRSYHWENMLKTKINNNNPDKVFPRISTNIKNTTIGIMPDKINVFLDDVLDMINVDIKQFLNI
ncbi:MULTISPECIES: hypothetical protein [unclassified Campylobacter]|uniref:hypothetical protein n=1 Tax=unclassified Campylobacter TaxID=2593542 RepID=UPI001DCEB770|nr:hypothetical protein [Campylobacter sp. RM9331]MBZ8004812.1 hypothetical protein [Campylobacter sp. RM9332]